MMKPFSREPGHDLLTMANAAVGAMQGLLEDAVGKLQGRVTVEGRVVGRLFDREQRATHGLAWLATYVEALRQLASYADRIGMDGHLGEVEELVVRIGFGEYLAQIFGGIPMSQSEIVRLADMGLTRDEVSARMTDFVEALIASGNTAQRRSRLVELLRAQRDANPGMSAYDDTAESIRDEMHKFSVSEVAPRVQRWHSGNEYISSDLIAHLAELGLFGLAIPEEFDGMGLGKQAMCVATEELSRGYIGIGSLGIRSEIAADLILNHGTEEQKRTWLPGLATGEVLPAVAFSEPNSGSDLASITTRASADEKFYRVYGTKTWVTYGDRSDLLLLLVRTNPRDLSHRGLSLLLAGKPRGQDDRPFLMPGLTGKEVAAVGFRGLKQYELAFDGFKVSVTGLLGGIEGLGFKQVMQALESARIQTAARAIGVAQSALDQAAMHAVRRQQFGMPIIAFPRIADKIAMMVTEITVARQLTYFAAREKDSGLRADAQTGMARLLASRVAWTAADSSVQVHGAGGVAAESSIARILADARVLGLMEGSSEILAQMVARRLLESTN